MAGSNVKAIIDEYRPVHDQYQLVQRQLAALDANGVSTKEASLRKQLLDQLVVGWPYPWDDGHTVIKRKTGLTSYELVVVDGGTSVSPDQAPAPSSWKLGSRTAQLLKYAACAAVSIAAANGLPRGCEWPIPVPAPATDAAAAGVDYARNSLLPGLAKAFRDTGSRVSDATKPGMPPMTDANLSAIQTDHVSRVKSAVVAGDAAFAAQLQRVIPVPIDFTAVTPDQWRAYSEVFNDFGDGIQSEAK